MLTNSQQQNKMVLEGTPGTLKDPDQVYLKCDSEGHSRKCSWWGRRRLLAHTAVYCPRVNSRQRLAETRGGAPGGVLLSKAFGLGGDGEVS